MIIILSWNHVSCEKSKCSVVRNFAPAMAGSGHGGKHPKSHPSPTDSVGIFSPIISLNRIRHRLADCNAQYLPDLLEAGTTNGADTLYSRLERDCRYLSPYESISATEKAIKMDRHTGTVDQSTRIMTAKLTSSKASLQQDELPREKPDKPFGLPSSNSRDPGHGQDSPESALNAALAENEEMKGSNPAPLPDVTQGLPKI